MLKNTVLLSCIAVFAAGCGLEHLGQIGQSIKGSGKLKSETRQVANFTGIDIGGATKAEVTVGPRASLRIEADDNLLSRVVTEIKGDKLHISMKGPVSTKHGLKAWITLPDLRSVDVSGASRMSVKGLRASRFSGDFSGASDAKLEGRAEELSLDVSGASSVDLSGVQCRTANIDASGASSVKVRATDRLRAQASGASSVRYYGNPAVTKEESGASSVRKVE